MSVGQVIEVKDAKKEYGSRIAVDRVSFEIKKNECFGLLGPNGAGKTSLMKMMYGSVQITSGQIYVLGFNAQQQIREIKSRIGVIPQEDGLDPDFTVLENLLVYASYHDIPKELAFEKAMSLLKWLRLDEYVHSHVEGLSGGLKRRLVIARSLLNDPEILFLDEPTTGLDPQAREWIWDFFKELRKTKASLVLTTHYMEEAEKMCDRVAMIDQGKILAIDTPQKLIRDQIGTEVVEVFIPNIEHEYFVNKLSKAGYNAFSLRQKIVIFIQSQQTVAEALAHLQAKEFFVRKASLNDVFLKLSGHDLVE